MLIKGEENNMNRPFRLRLAAAAICWTLASGAVPVAAWADGGSAAAGQTQSVAEIPVLGTIPLPGGGSIEIKQASVLASDEGKLAAFTLALHNEADYELQFIDYWVRLMNASGTSFTVQIMPQDKDKNRVAPHSTLDLNMYAKISPETDLKDLIFRIVKWDFSAPNYERKLGDIAVPGDYSVVTPAESARLVQVAGAEVKMGAVQLDAGQNSEYYLPKIRFRLENVGMKTAEVPAYQFSLRTKEGLLYPLQVKGLEENNRSLYPRFVKDLELTGKLPLSVGAEGWELVLTTRADVGGSVGKLTMPAAFFALPAAGGISDDSTTPVDTAKSIDVGTHTLETKVDKVNRTKRDVSYSVSITFGLKNTGSGSVTLPGYRFAVQTSEGLTYPAKAEGIKDMVIDPLFRKEVQLTAVIPSSVSPRGWKLLLLPPADANGGTSSEAALSVYQLSDTSADQGMVGEAHEFTNKNGTYTSILNSIQRLPWEDKDIVSANLTVSNLGTAPLPVPSFSGYFLLDDVVRVPASAILKDSIISVKPGGALNLQLFGKIPYTNEYSTIKMVLQEKEGENAAADLLEFRSGSQVSEIPQVPFSGSFRVEGIGRQASISVRDTRTYAGGETNLFSVQVKVQNLEKRYTGTGSYVAYLKTSDGTVYPATVHATDKKISPNGFALLYISSYLPNTVASSDLTLILGAGIKEGKLNQTGASEGYIEAVSYKLPVESKASGKALSQIDLFPYTLQVSNLKLKSTPEHIDLIVKYKLNKNQLVESDTKDHKVVMEMEDKRNNIKLTKSFTLNKGGADSLNTGEGSFTLDGLDFPNWYVHVSTYQFRIYEEFQGVRKLLAEQEIDYFTGLTLP
jgi:hypothetical protein